MTNPYDLTTHDGKRVDWMTKAAIMEAEEILGYPLSITQGSYNAGSVSASAGTHDGGGVVDLRGWDSVNKVRALRKVGFAAWRRLPSQGPWPEHVHAVLIGNEKLASSAQRQVTAYLAGRNGLANNGFDDGPREHVGNRFVWRGVPKPPPEKRGIHLCYAGDWNEGPRSIGRYSSEWIAKQGGMNIYLPPPNKRGQFGIDYMLSSAPCTNVRRLEEPHSDHEPIAFDVTHPVATLRKSLRGCTFNVRRDRTDIEREALRRWLAEQEVDFYALQECKQYQTLLRSVEGFTLVEPDFDDMPEGGDHNAILVRNGVTVTDAKTKQTSSAGWFTRTGKSHVPATVALATLDDWLRVGSVHEVVSTDLRDGTWLGPVRRVAARISSARTLAKIGRYWKARR